MINDSNKLRLILGDKLNATHPWFEKIDDNCLYVIAELHQETNYVTHHLQKVQAFFAAMTAFAKALKKAGHRVLHLTLDDTKQYKDLPDMLTCLLDNDVQHFEYQQPDEYRLSEQLAIFSQQLVSKNISCACIDSHHFYLPHHELTAHFKVETSHRMEFF